MAGRAGDIGEFELIADYFAPLGACPRLATSDRIPLGIGDDAALLNGATGKQLAISVDTLVAGVHFPVDGPARLIAHKALRSNLSDLAAMGATPLAYTLALTLPTADRSWLAEFSAGLREVGNDFPIALIGGDTTRGNQLVITVQIFGEIPAGNALLRSGARPGDTIFVTGTLGDARAALDILQLPADTLDDPQRFLLDRYYRPSPRIEFAQQLRGIATAAIDISDGLAADLGHILNASGAGAEIELAALPLSGATPAAHAQQYALSGGDDYEICFTAPAASTEKIRELAAHFSTRLSIIGRVTGKGGLVVRDREGGIVSLANAGGYTHF
jgi:thiamine-monophosphate kinase